MCGRFTQTVNLSDIAAKYRVGTSPVSASLDSLPNDAGHIMVTNYNLAPSEEAVVVSSIDRGRDLQRARFGIDLVFGPSKLPKRIINARSETALSKATFSRAVRHSRCVVPANGYFEWMAQSSSSKIPYFIRPSHGDLASLAALRYQDKKTKSIGFVILTQAANSSVRHIHDRMPVLIPDSLLDPWLDGELNSPELTLELLLLAQDATDQTSLDFHPVTKAMGSPTFKSRGAIESI